jgi:hypothetical protein
MHSTDTSDTSGNTTQRRIEHRPTARRTDRRTGLRSDRHQPGCPATDGPTSPVAACTVAAHPEQGWRLLCNGVVLFDDGGYLLPATTSAAPAAQPVAA